MIILASNSPRRKELLKQILPEFKIIPSNIDEKIPDTILPMDAAVYLSTQKCLDVYRNNPNDLVIAADTLIILDNKIYGKPINKDDAKRMLMKFANKTHYVVTGVCISSETNTISFSSVNEVEFYALCEREIDEYLKDDEYKDKAGAYAIQGKGSLFIKSMKGDYNGIVGLPIAQLNRVLHQFFNI